MGNTIEGLAEPISVKQTDIGCIEVPGSSGAKHKSKHNEEPCPTIRYAASSMQGWRLSMEDAHILSPSLTIPLPDSKWPGSLTLYDHAFFAVFDGHGGSFTSTYASEQALRVLTSRKEWADYVQLSETNRGDTPGVHLLESALIGTFLDLDEELHSEHLRNLEEVLAKEESRQTTEGCRDVGAIRQLLTTSVQSNSAEEGGVELFLSSIQQGAIKVDRSGSTAVGVLITPTHILCVNAGDSRAMIVKSGIALPLSFDHKPTNPSELCRILDAGGDVKSKRIDGDLAVSRGLGDFRFKDSELPPRGSKVTATPDIIINPRHKDDEFVLLACDGVWDVMDTAQCGKAVQEILDEGETDIGLVCEELLDRCLDLDSRDNMTACLVVFPGCSFMQRVGKEHNNRGGVQALRDRRRTEKLATRESKQIRPMQLREVLPKSNQLPIKKKKSSRVTRNDGSVAKKKMPDEVVSQVHALSE